MSKMLLQGQKKSIFVLILLLHDMNEWVAKLYVFTLSSILSLTGRGRNFCGEMNNDKETFFL